MWFNIFLNNLKKVKLPKKTDQEKWYKNKYKNYIYFFILLFIPPFIPSLSLIFFDFIFFCFFGKYGYLSLILLGFVFIEKIQKLTKQNLKNFVFEGFYFVRDNIFWLLGSSILIGIHPFFKYILNFKNGFKNLFMMFPIIPINRNDIIPSVLLEKTKSFQ
jgi:hypothetical protein